MKILLVDTTTADLVVAVVEENGIRDFSKPACGTHHSVVLCQCVKQALESCNLTFDDLDAYACVVGPGSFTGIRIGIATIKGYSFAVPKPLVALNSLEAIAYSDVCGKGRSAAIDAGNGYYFADLENGIEPCLLNYDDEHAKNACRAQGAANYLDGAVKLVRERFVQQNFVSEFVPLYIRRSQAEENKCLKN